jgi:hypothetical protein
MPASSDASVWDAIARRDFLAWQGLPSPASYADFDARFERLVDAEGVGFLGRTNVRARYRRHVGEGYPQYLRAWYVDERLALVEAALPQLPYAAADLLAVFTSPAATLDFSWGVLAVPGGAHVHPERGITLFVGPEEQILRLSLYTPCLLDTYLDTIHRTEELIERPLRRSD